MDEHNPRNEDEVGRTNEEDLVDISDDEEEFEDLPDDDDEAEDVEEE
jgi:hypothetical protein